MKITTILLMLFLVGLRAARFRRSVTHESKQRICYEHLGCFDVLPPFSPKMPLPMSPSQLNTTFHLNSREISNQQIQPNTSSIITSYFDPERKTKILVHGFMTSDSGLAKWIQEVTDAILNQEDVNVVQVDWSKGASVEYERAVSNTRMVGAQIGYLISMIMEVYDDVTAEDFHIVGFSLGAHVAGFAGKKVKAGGKKNIVGRITGLDPASPGFNYDSPKVRLDKSDAKFVDVIHTDTHTLLGIASGLDRNLGHVDFYPNGGADQTGCHEESQNWMKALTDKTVCDHLRAPELFKASINATGTEPHMIGFKCSNFDRFKRGVCLRCRGGSSCRRMGYWAEPPSSKKKEHQYFLLTSGLVPYTMKHYQAQLHWRKSSLSTSSGFKAKLFLTLHGDLGSTPEIALNDGATFHVVAGKTTRFLITQDSVEDIGELQRVVFRWERPSCSLWFFCSTENIYLKRIKIFDSVKQRWSVHLPLGKTRAERVHSHFVKPDEEFELLRSTYIRSLYPRRRFTSLVKEENALKNIIHPPIIALHRNETSIKHLQSEDIYEKINSTTSVYQSDATST